MDERKAMKYILVIVAGLTLAQFFIPADGRSTGALIYSTIPETAVILSDKH